MKVKTIKPHGNHFGKKYQKAIGDIYDHPTPQSDISFRYVVEYRPAAAKKVPAKKTAPTPKKTSAKVTK